MKELPMIEPNLRMVKIGRFFYVMIHLVVMDDFHVHEIKELDDIRYRIAQALRDCHSRLIIDVIFTADKRWILGDVKKICNY